MAESTKEQNKKRSLASPEFLQQWVYCVHNIYGLIWYLQKGNTPLFVAVRSNCTQAIKALLNSSQADQDVRFGKSVRTLDSQTPH